MIILDDLFIYECVCVRVWYYEYFLLVLCGDLVIAIRFFFNDFLTNSDVVCFSVRMITIELYREQWTQKKVRQYYAQYRTTFLIPFSLFLFRNKLFHTLCYFAVLLCTLDRYILVCPQTFSHTVMCKVCLTASNTLFDADAFVPLNF